MVAVTSLVAFNVIPATLETAVVLGGALLILVPLGGRFATALSANDSSQVPSDLDSLPQEK
jgi:hypothetical protein